MSENGSVIRLRNMQTYFYLEEGVLKAVDGVSLDIPRNRTIGIIGESGCGKSVTAQSILSIVPPPGRTVGGSIEFQLPGEDPVDIAKLDPNGDEIRKIRGKHISMIFQEPMTSLSPVHSIGRQLTEPVMLHLGKTKDEAHDLVVEMLARVGISNGEQRFEEYPHQLSGGLRQRVMIAMALMCHPSLLIADEPTTALDVTVQAQILELMKELQDQFGMGILYITHDLGVIAEVASEVAVMYLGRVVEKAPTRELFHNPLHPYTRLLLKSIPKLGKKARTRLEAINGTVPIPLDPPAMCGFFSRCPDRKVGKCNAYVPALVEAEPDHWVRCFLHSEEMEEVREPSMKTKGRKYERAAR